MARSIVERAIGAPLTGKPRNDMNTYDPLRNCLMIQKGKEVSAHSEDIEDEDRIGVQLPPSAREHREWWGNETNPNTRHRQCLAWLQAGWKVKNVDLSKEVVTFERISG